MYPEVLRNRAVFHYKRFDTTLRKSAHIFGLGKSTLARWVKPIVGCRNRRQSKFSEMKELIAEFLDKNPFLSLDDLCRAVSHRVSSTTMRHYLKRAGYSRKRTKNVVKRSVNSSDSSTKLEKLRECFSSEGEIISLDETCIYLRKPPVYGYSRRGKGLEVTSSKGLRSDKVSLLLAVSSTRGVVGYEIVRGSFNSCSFAQFILDLNASHGSKLIMDNVSFHHSANVREAFLTKGFKYYYTPPYSPELNPVEYCFAMLKNSYRKQYSFPSALSILSLEIEKLPREKIARCFRHVSDALSHSQPLPL
jgi:transposase